MTERLLEQDLLWWYNNCDKITRIARVPVSDLAKHYSKWGPHPLQGASVSNSVSNDTTVVEDDGDAEENDERTIVLMAGDQRITVRTLPPRKKRFIIDSDEDVPVI